MTYNRLEYTRRTLPVLLENSEDAEVHIVDNGSTDGTVEYLQAFDTDRTLLMTFNDYNEGIVPTMNYFLSATKDRDYIAKVDNDTMVPEGWLDRMVSAMVESDVDIMQAKHHFWMSGYRDWDDFESRRRNVGVSGGRVFPHHYVGGSPIVINRQSLTDGIAQREGLLNGWTAYQARRPGLRKAFFDGVWADILDKDTYNTYTTGTDRRYIHNIGRGYRFHGRKDDSE